MNASDFGFSPAASGVDNSRALQKAVDQGGTIHVSQPGVYKLAGTVYVGSDTALIFGHGVTVQKVDETGFFMHVLLNKGALTKTTDRNIVVEGLHLAVNGQDGLNWKVFGLRGQVGFFHVHDLTIRRFRCYDLGRWQFALHVCTFEDVIVEDVIVHGDKDGVHLGRGKRFRISDGVFKTFDDAIALNAHDYDTGNPELGWIEDGIVENCHDLDAEKTTGFFCRLQAGAWIDWQPGMSVQKSDTVVAHGRLYRVKADPDGKVYQSHTCPTHESGTQEIDGINWVMVQDDVLYNVGVRNVVFRDIILHKPRIGFSAQFDEGRFSRSYYPDAVVPQQTGLNFERITVAHAAPAALFSISTPVDTITLSHCIFRDSPIEFLNRESPIPWGKTILSLTNCTFVRPGQFTFVNNHAPGKNIILRTAGSLVLEDDFKAATEAGPGTINCHSDLPGLN
jgi:hypothetical protein